MPQPIPPFKLDKYTGATLTNGQPERAGRAIGNLDGYSDLLSAFKASIYYGPGVAVFDTDGRDVTEDGFIEWVNAH